MPSLMDDPKTESMLRAILALKDMQEAKAFFRDLLTAAEVQESANRWTAAQMLHDKISYNTIQKATGLSTTTIARTSKWLKKGKGGFKLMVKRLKPENK